jgi:hypothetical protein
VSLHLHNWSFLAVYETVVDPNNSVSINHFSSYTRGNISIPVFQHGYTPRAAAQQYHIEEYKSRVMAALLFKELGDSARGSA